MAEDDWVKLRQMSGIGEAKPVAKDENPPSAYTRYTHTPVYLYNFEALAKALANEFGKGGFTVQVEGPPPRSSQQGAEGEYYPDSDRIHIEYGDQTNPWQLQDVIRHEDVHAALERGLKHIEPPDPLPVDPTSWKAQLQSMWDDPKEAAEQAWYTAGRAGEKQVEIPAYMAADPYRLGISNQQRYHYLNMMAGALAAKNTALAKMYLRMAQGFTGDESGPTPASMRKPEKKK